MNLKTFYGGLIVVAVAGGGAIWLAGRQGDQASVTQPTGPVDTTTLPAYTMGSASAPIQIIQFADFECPACGRYAVLTEPDVRERLVQTGRVRLVFRDRMISGHDKSPVAHLAAACAAEQDKFWPMHDSLYYNQVAWVEGNTERKLRGYAKSIGIDVDRYDACMSAKRYTARIASSTARADSVGITQTPSFLINGQLRVGAFDYDRLKLMLDSIAPMAKPKA